MALAALALVAWGGLSAPGSAAPAEPFEESRGTWRPVDASTGRLTAVPDLEALAQAFPDSASVHLRLLNAYLDGERIEEAYRLARDLVARGHRFSSGSAEKLHALFAQAGHPERFVPGRPDPGGRESSTLAATVPGDIHLVEAALRERESGRIYVTSVVSRGLFRQDGRGGWERVELGPTGSLGGIAQAPDGWLWAASGVYEQTPEPETAFRGLVGYDPASGRTRRVAAPADAAPSDLAIGDDGTLYASDPYSGAIYRGRADADRLDLLVAPGVFRSPQGLAPAPDGRLLYASDYRYGLAVIDLATGRVDRLASVAGKWLDGTDGLWLHGDLLVAMQNGQSLPQITALSLDPARRSIDAGAALERANPRWTEPAGGSVSREDLIYVGTGQWDRFGPGGAPVAGKPPLPTEIRLLTTPERPVLPPKNPG